MEKYQLNTDFNGKISVSNQFFPMGITYLWSDNYISLVWELHIFDIKMVLSQDLSFLTDLRKVNSNILRSQVNKYIGKRKTRNIFLTVKNR